MMPLRPRYSLLTLLVLTALIAGGVKLWYGPHRVVERVSSDHEREYTYTRDWRGNKIIDGVMVERHYREGILTSVGFDYFRQGEECGGISFYEIDLENGVPMQQPLLNIRPRGSPNQQPLVLHTLSDNELLNFRLAVEKEDERITTLNMRIVREHLHRDPAFPAGLELNR
jgi:hypothetical protein